MKILFFSEDRISVIDALKDYSSNIDFKKLNEIEENSDSFNIVVVLDDDRNVIDYRVFDPFRIVLDGYITPSGWSNWGMEHIFDIDSLVEDFNLSEEEKEIIEDINNY